MSTQTVEPQTGLIKLDEANELIISGLKEALPYCQKLNTLAKSAFKGVLDTIEGGEMNAELDTALNDLIVRGSSAIEKMQAKRKPGTQMMAQVSKILTTMENEIEVLKTTAQGYRNDWAKKQAQIRQQEEQAILKKQNAAREKTELKSEIESQVRAAYQSKLFAFKKSALDKFNSLTLDNVDEIKKALKEIKLIYPHDKFLELGVNITAMYMEPSEKAALIYDTRASLFDELSANFRENMEDVQQSLLGQITSRVNELKEQKNANEATQKLMQQQAEQRQREQEENLRREQEQNRIADMQRLEMNKQIEHTQTLFDTTSQLSLVNTDTSKVRQGYKINVLSMTGWMAIANYWFSKEGSNMKPTDAGKKTLDQMKAFCEKHTHKKPNEKLVHDHVIYEEEFKAVNVKNS